MYWMEQCEYLCKILKWIPTNQTDLFSNLNNMSGMTKPKPVSHMTFMPWAGLTHMKYLFPNSCSQFNIFGLLKD